MKISKISNHQLCIELSRAELRAMDITFDDISHESEDTQTLMISLLEAARLSTGFDPQTKVFIEVLPSAAGGCSIYFSDIDEDDMSSFQPKTRVPSPVIYAFDDIDHLIAGAVKLFRRCSHRILKSTLYKVRDSWRLAIYPLDIIENISLALLDEFAPRCGQGEVAAAWLEEYADKILAENAVDLLSAYFS